MELVLVKKADVLKQIANRFIFFGWCGFDGFKEGCTTFTKGDCSAVVTLIFSENSTLVSFKVRITSVSSPKMLELMASLDLEEVLNLLDGIL